MALLEQYIHIIAHLPVKSRDDREELQNCKFFNSCGITKAVAKDLMENEKARVLLFRNLAFSIRQFVLFYEFISKS